MTKNELVRELAEDFELPRKQVADLIEGLIEKITADIIVVTGDAYVDHPSFGMAIIGRLLEAQGFRVGIIAQPDWQSAAPFAALGRPNLFFGVTGGNMDSMVNRYTADRRLRHNDSYTPGGEGGKRPDRAAIVYAQRCREAFRDVPIVLGGIEASLRRIAHYDYWSDTVRRSILADAKADVLLYGNAERAVVEVAHRLAKAGARAGEMAEAIAGLDDIRGVALMKSAVPDGWTQAHADDLDVADEGAPDRGGKHRHPPAGVRAGQRKTARPMRGPPACSTARAIPAMPAPWCSATATANFG